MFCCWNWINSVTLVCRSCRQFFFFFERLLYWASDLMSVICWLAAAASCSGGPPLPSSCFSFSRFHPLLYPSVPPSLCSAPQKQLTPWHHHPLALPQTALFLSVISKHLKRTQSLTAHAAFNGYQDMESHKTSNQKEWVFTLNWVRERTW